MIPKLLPPHLAVLNRLILLLLLLLVITYAEVIRLGKWRHTPPLGSHGGGNIVVLIMKPVFLSGKSLLLCQGETDCSFSADTTECL
jgi:hypothetical protein